MLTGQYDPAGTRQPGSNFVTGGVDVRLVEIVATVIFEEVLQGPGSAVGAAWAVRQSLAFAAVKSDSSN